MSVHGVGVTAVAVAAARALESDRPDPLVRDPWARELTRASGVAVPFPERWSDDPDEVPAIEQSMLLGALYIGMRTRFIDDELRAGGLRQAVILGSGLDTRSWRLDWPDGTRVFELDSPDVVDFVGRTMDAVAPSRWRPASPWTSCSRAPIRPTRRRCSAPRAGRSTRSPSKTSNAATNARCASIAPTARRMPVAGSCSRTERPDPAATRPHARRTNGEGRRASAQRPPVRHRVRR